MLTVKTHSTSCALASMKRTHAQSSLKYRASRALPILFPGHGFSITTYLHPGSSSYGGALFSRGGIGAGIRDRRRRECRALRGGGKGEGEGMLLGHGRQVQELYWRVLRELIEDVFEDRVRKPRCGARNGLQTHGG